MQALVSRMGLGDRMQGLARKTVIVLDFPRGSAVGAP